MKCSNSYRNWIRGSYLDKWDVRLLTNIAKYKAGEIQRFHNSKPKKIRLEKIREKVQAVVKKDIFPFKDELTEEDVANVNSVVAEILDFTL